MRIFNLYVKVRNFLVSNFFINILCLKHQNTFIYLDNKYSIYRYLLLLCPFYFVNLITNKYNYEIIYKMDNTYNITNIDENHIIPFIQSCIAINDYSSLNISSDIRLYNSSIPLHFFINTCNLHSYNIIKLVYLNKGVKIEKEINLNNIDTKKYLIYNLFNN
jgi:hypothetical protein